jgi:REP element-mobilizing transposase RayT
MPQSLANVQIHLIFSTFQRTPNLVPNVRRDLHPYLAATLNQLDCHAIEVGGVDDHIHVLFRQSRTLTIAKVVQDLKTSSSKMLKSRVRDFSWQSGYGAFSVSPADSGSVSAYIKDQVDHHKKLTFQEEYRQILEDYGVPFDERFVWD